MREQVVRAYPRHFGNVRGQVRTWMDVSSFKTNVRATNFTTDSIAAAMCAIKSPDELLRDICVNTVSTDYMLTGEMKRKNVSWFPELYKMG